MWTVFSQVCRENHLCASHNSTCLPGKSLIDVLMVRRTFLGSCFPLVWQNAAWKRTSKKVWTCAHTLAAERRDVWQQQLRQPVATLKDLVEKQYVGGWWSTAGKTGPVATFPVPELVFNAACWKVGIDVGHVALALAHLWVRQRILTFSSVYFSENIVSKNEKSTCRTNWKSLLKFSLSFDIQTSFLLQF